MTPMPNNSTSAEDLPHDLVLPLAELIGWSNIVYMDFHGQKEGDDLGFDEKCRKEKEARANFLAALQRSQERVVLEARIDELTQSDLHSSDSTAVPYGVRRWSELQAQLSALIGKEGQK